jgi:hypothetical protein
MYNFGLISQESAGILFLVFVVVIVGGGVLIHHLRGKYDAYATRRSVRTLEAMKEYRNTVRGNDPL